MALVHTHNLVPMVALFKVRASRPLNSLNRVYKIWKKFTELKNIQNKKKTLQLCLGLSLFYKKEKEKKKDWSQWAFSGKNKKQSTKLTPTDH